jgi:hypothetical protein
LGSIKRARKRGEATQQQVKKQPKQPVKDYLTIENEDVAGVVAIGQKRSGLASVKVYKTGRPANDKDSLIQDGGSSDIMGKKV